MKKLLFFFYAIALVVFSSYTVYEKEKTISDFKLKSATTNRWVSLSDYKNAKGFVVVFSCNKCPMAKFYSQRLNQMDAKYKKLGVPVLAINSMDTLAYAEESFKLMQKKAKKDQFQFPYLQDKKQNIAKEFKATHTPQAFVIWKNNVGKFVIKYQGAIDDNAGEPEKIKHHFLTDAIDDLLQEKEVATPKSESFGCRIYFRGEVQKMD
ncbi:thioredoxin family protein [Flavobacterium sp.]|uniref:thioredoxin family protein n=1 Tax=Flavobacterium sp. TaxID=239 RepID=UPI003BDE7413